MNLRNVVKRSTIGLLASMVVFSGLSFNNEEAQAATTATVSINTSSVVQENFGGLGYNMDPSYDFGNNQVWESRIAKSIKEVSPEGYFRVMGLSISNYAPTETTRTWDSPAMTRLYRSLQLLKDNGIKVYLMMGYKNNPAWLGGGNVITDATTQDKWAQASLDGVKYLVETKGFTNIIQWCVGNEAETNEGWGHFYYGGETPQNSYEALVTKFRAKLAASTISNAGIKIVAPDAGGAFNFDMIKWWGDLTPITDLFGEHDYTPGAQWNIGDDSTSYPAVTTGNWTDPVNYDRTLQRYKYHVDYVKNNKGGKQLNLGEFGSLGQTVDKDNFYYGMDQGIYGIVTSEMAIAALNAGYSNIAKWSLNDLQYGEYTYRFGTLAGAAQNYAARPDYYSYGLMTRYIRNNSRVYSVSSTDSNIRAAAVRNKGDQTDTIVVVNRNSTPTTVTFQYSGSAPTKAFRKFVYNPSSVPSNPGGDLQPHSGKIAMSGSNLVDSVAAGTMVVYTTEYSETAPGPVGGIWLGSDKTLHWNANPGAIYYRVYRSSDPNFTPGPSNHIGSTSGTSFYDPGNNFGLHYRFKAVDKYGNVGP